MAGLSPHIPVSPLDHKIKLKGLKKLPVTSVKSGSIVSWYPVSFFPNPGKFFSCLNLMVTQQNKRGTHQSNFHEKPPKVTTEENVLQVSKGRVAYKITTNKVRPEIISH